MIPKIEFDCPFCQRLVKTSSEAIMHQMPMCEQFARLEPDEYLAEVNNTIMGREVADRVRERIAKEREEKEVKKVLN